MGVVMTPTFQFIKEKIEWLDKLEDGDFAARIIFQAMKWASEGFLCPGVEKYYKESVYKPGYMMHSLEFYATYDRRVNIALDIINHVVDGHGVEYSKSQNCEYINVGDGYATTIIYDRENARWLVRSLF